MWIENILALVCHHVVFVINIEVATTRGPESAHVSFLLRETERDNHIVPRVASSAWRQRRRSYGVFKSWNSVTHCRFQQKWWMLHNYQISVLEQVGMFSNGIIYLMTVLPVFEREFPRLLMTSCQGHCMHFYGMWPTILWKHFIIYIVQLVCTTAISPWSHCMLFTTFGLFLSLPVDHSRQPVVLNLYGTSHRLVSTV